MQPRKFRTTTLFLAAVLTCTAAARADATKIASIDLKLAYSNLQETIDTNHDLADLQKQLDAMVKSHQAELTPADPKKSAALSVEEHDAKELDFTRQEQLLKLQMTRKQCAEMAHAWQEIHDAVNQLASSRGLDLVLVGGNPPMPFGSADIPNADTVGKLLLNREFAYTDVDITVDVIAAVNRTYRSTIAPLPALPTTAMKIGPTTFQLEIAADDASQEHGLMERDTLAPDHGMIFVFADEAYRNFWMHHTRFPLDIIFADARGKVVSVKSMKPYDESGIPSEEPAKYAIELPSGSTQAVKPGDMLSIPAAATKK